MIIFIHADANNNGNNVYVKFKTQWNISDTKKANSIIKLYDDCNIKHVWMTQHTLLKCMCQSFSYMYTNHHTS